MLLNLVSCSDSDDGVNPSGRLFEKKRGDVAGGVAEIRFIESKAKANHMRAGRNFPPSVDVNLTVRTIDERAVRGC
jgi:hypothetical protein